MSKPPETIKVSVPKATAVPVAEPTPTEPEGMLKKGELLDSLVAQTGVKRSDAKAVLEGVLTLITDQLQAGRDLQLPPLGKIKLVKSKTVGQGATALTVKIRQPKPATDASG